MLFTSLIYWPFFLLVALLCGLARGRLRVLILVVASLLFYAYWNTLLVWALLGFTVFNYLMSLVIGRSRALLALSIAADLAVLGFFKYYNFLVASAAGLFGFSAEPFILNIVLPVAVSFYTFEAISYNVDIYRGDVQPRKSFLDFALFLSLFPHLTAGPIIRPSNFFPQIDHGKHSDAGVRWGVLQIVKGLIKKMVFADNLAPVSTQFFGHIGSSPDAVSAWAAVLAFGLQIYCDFAGYTDIARGCSRILGFDFPSNFERPYLSADIAEFWRRWHISLSTWLRDYLYIPLGGNRRGAARTYLNLLIVMGLGGLWHGASWNFVVWGLYHGVLLAAHRFTSGFVSRASFWYSRAMVPVRVAFTFLLVNLGWILFRAPDFHASLLTLKALFAFRHGADYSLLLLPALLLAISLAWCLADRGRKLQHYLFEGGGLRFPLSFATSLLLIEIFAKTDIAIPFIYFRF